MNNATYLWHIMYSTYSIPPETQHSINLDDQNPQQPSEKTQHSTGKYIVLNEGSLESSSYLPHCDICQNN